MLKGVIIDDEDKARQNLKNIIENHCPQLDIVGEADNVKKGQSIISKKRPDVVFLDIKMQGETGFDLLKKIHHIDFEIIFVTAYDEYAIKAIRFAALDYLLKPIDIEKLQAAIRRVKDKKQNTTYDKFSHLMEQLQQETSFRKIALPTMKGQKFVELDDIIRCEAEDNYTRFFLKGGKEVLVSKTIKHFESLLKEHHFFRVHQSHLVNLKFVKEYIKKEGGYIKMADGSEVLLSRRRKKPFLQKLSALQ